LQGFRGGRGQEEPEEQGKGEEKNCTDNDVRNYCLAGETNETTGEEEGSGEGEENKGVGWGEENGQRGGDDITYNGLGGNFPDRG